MRTTPIDRAKVAMGYQTAMQRPCCRNCQQQRAAVLLASRNHLLPLSPSARPADFLRALARRH